MVDYIIQKIYKNKKLKKKYYKLSKPEELRELSKNIKEISIEYDF